MTIFGLAWWVVTHANEMRLLSTSLPPTDNRAQPPPSQTQANIKTMTWRS